MNTLEVQKYNKELELFNKNQNNLNTENKLSMNKSDYGKPEKLYEVDMNGVAHAQIKGVLNSKRNLFDVLFGYAPTLTYQEIIDMADQVDSDPRVKELVIHADSPGGMSMGADDASVAISLINKPVTTLIEGQLASAAYYVTAGSDKIIATSEQNQIGSIGTVVSIPLDSESIKISSSDAPNKVPDPSTPEGKSVIQKQLDEIQSLFVRRVAEGRGISIQKVQSDFGQGGVFLARQALASGMIDEIRTLEDRKKVSQVNVSQTQSIHSAKSENKNIDKGKKMDLEKLKSEFPSVFAEAIQIGVKQERERVNSLKSFAEADKENSKVKEIVEEAIQNGNTFESIQAKLLVAMRDFKQVNTPPGIPVESIDPVSQKNDSNDDEIEKAFSKMFSRGNK
jgi:ClpP class serine protease